jgi:hypothetical protein
MAAEDEVRQASERFYAALNSTLDGDRSPTEQIWSHGSDVSAMHPTGGRMLGWEEVGPPGSGLPKRPPVRKWHWMTWSWFP